MEFEFNSEEEELALTGRDVDIYPYLGIIRRSHFYKNKNRPLYLCGDDIKVTKSDYSGRPLIVDNLRQFADNLRSMTGHWDISWFDTVQNSQDFIYNDRFRSVVASGCVDFTIRPVQDDIYTRRLSLAPGDLQYCLFAAIDIVLNANQEPPITAVIGEGSVRNPRDRLSADKPGFERIPFEWKITHAPQDLLASRIRRWRHKVCGGVRLYNLRGKEYLDFLKELELQDPSIGMRDNNLLHSGKRSREEVAGSEGLSPSSKRQSLSSRSNASSQAESAPPSSASSPDMVRLPPVAAWAPPITAGPEFVGFERSMLQPWSNRVTSTSPVRARVSSGLADMSIQSPAMGPTVIVSPPTSGVSSVQADSRYRLPPPVSSLATNQGVPSSYEQRGKGYGQQSQDNLHETIGPAPQLPDPRYQDPGRVQQPPGYGQLVDIYGRPIQEPQSSRPPRPPQIGIEHTQFQDGRWNPPQPGPSVPVMQAPAQDFRRAGHAGFVHAQSGGASADHRVRTAPVPSPTSMRPANHPSGAQRAAAMPGTEFHASQYQSITPASLGPGRYPPSYPLPAPTAPSLSVNVFDYLAPPAASSSGRGSTSMPYQETSANVPAGWTDQYGRFNPYRPGPSGGSQPLYPDSYEEEHESD